jgi:hypothetical protein
MHHLGERLELQVGIQDLRRQRDHARAKVRNAGAETVAQLRDIELRAHALQLEERGGEGVDPALVGLDARDPVRQAVEGAMSGIHRHRDADRADNRPTASSRRAKASYAFDPTWPGCRPRKGGIGEAGGATGRARVAAGGHAAGRRPS